MNVCKGSNPRVGDRVLVEAVYNAAMPFKWNATRITTLPGASGGGNNAAQAANPQTSLLGAGGGGQRAGSRFSDINQQPLGNRGFGGGNDNNRRGFGDNNRGFGGGGGNDRGFSGGPDRPGLGFSEGSGRDRQRSPRRDDKKRDDRSSRKRSRSRSRSRSPSRRRARNMPRYNVSVPKVLLTMDSSLVMELKKRYNSLYIPSDFFKANHVWREAFPIEAPFNIRYPASFTVMNKELVEPATVNKFTYDPPDADYTYVAKVMLLASPALEELYEKTCHLIEKVNENIS